MNKAQFRDALQANLGFVERATATIEAGVYAQRYPDLDYAALIPVETGANEWTKTVTYYSMTGGAGAARWINGNAKDIPVVGVNFNQHETAVFMAGIGYDYGFEEVNQARMLGVPLDAMKAQIARRAYEQFVYDVAFIGDAAKGFQGLFNTSGITTVTVAAVGAQNGANNSTLWANKTADQIVDDVNSLLAGVYIGSNTVEMADTLLLPYERLVALAGRRIGDTTTTVLEYLRQNNVYTATTGQPLMIRGMRGLVAAGAGGTSRMIAYRRSPEVLKLHIPMPHRFLPVQVDVLQFIVPGVFRLGGLDVRLPGAVRYADGL